MNSKLKNQVEETLRNIPGTRNNDRHLTWCIWRNYYGIKDYITETMFAKLPEIDSIKRFRRKLNESGKYLPTEKRVLRARKIKEKEWRKELGYKSEPREKIIPVVAENNAPIQEKLL